MGMIQFVLGVVAGAFLQTVFAVDQLIIGLFQ